MIIFEDNLGFISLSKNLKYHSRTKHINIKYHYIHNAYENKTIQPKHCPTDKMIADVVTKGLPRPQFEKLCSKLALLNSLIQKDFTYIDWTW